MKSVPQQGDSSSCGVASLWNAHLLAMYEAPFDGHDFYFPYKGSDLKTIRKVIALDLITNTLTLPPCGFDDKEEDVRMPDDDSPDDDKSSRVTVIKGMMVSSRYQDNKTNEWFPGFISNVNKGKGDGVCNKVSIRYDDGVEEKDVLPTTDRITVLNKGNTCVHTFKAGDDVEGHFKAHVNVKNEWYKGKVIAVEQVKKYGLSHARYKVRYVDNDEEDLWEDLVRCLT